VLAGVVAGCPLLLGCTPQTLWYDFGLPAGAGRAYELKGESRRCCKFQRSPRGDAAEPREGRTRGGTFWGKKAEAPGQLKRLGTDAFTGVASSAKSEARAEDFVG
jgi:hypothetical protein